MAFLFSVFKVETLPLTPSVSSILGHINKILISFLRTNLETILILVPGNILTVVKSLETIIYVHISCDTRVFEIHMGLLQQESVLCPSFTSPIYPATTVKRFTIETDNILEAVLANPRN